MGKDIKGKDLGKGISQNKANKLYYVRFPSVSKPGEYITNYSCKTEEEAKSWYRRAKAEDELGLYRKHSNMTVDEWFEYWCKEIRSNLAKNTVSCDEARYEKDVKPILGKMKMRDVELSHCRRVLNNMTEKYSDRTIKMTHQLLRNLFNSAVEEEVLVRNPYKLKRKDLPLSKKVCKRKRVTKYTDEQSKLLFQAINSSTTVYKIQYRLLYECGLRYGELAGLKVQDIDFDNKVIHIQRQLTRVDNEWEFTYTKQGQRKDNLGYRDIPISKSCAKILQEAIENRKKIKASKKEYEDLLFLSSGGKPIVQTAYWVTLKNIVASNNLPHVSPHSLRHFFGNEFYKETKDAKSLSSLLGHSSISITMDMYVDDDDESKFEGINRLCEARQRKAIV